MSDVKKIQGCPVFMFGLVYLNKPNYSSIKVYNLGDHYILSCCKCDVASIPAVVTNHVDIKLVPYHYSQEEWHTNTLIGPLQINDISAPEGFQITAVPIVALLES